MKKALIAVSLFALPLVASAQNVSNLRSLIAEAGSILNMVIPVLIALALVVFFVGLIQYIWRRKGGREIMIAGLVGLFIMVSVWGIIRLAQNSLGLQNGQPIQPPYVPQTY
jgi:hypothetical protein